LITIAADDRFDFGDRLAEIRAPTLVVAGDRDPFYTPELVRGTAAGISNATLILFSGAGHPVEGKRFQRDVLAFLRGGG
jgi:pimeloyl-ACP methyl ester carboxylesterase